MLKRLMRFFFGCNHEQYSRVFSKIDGVGYKGPYVQCYSGCGKRLEYLGDGKLGKEVR